MGAFTGHLLSPDHATGFRGMIKNPSQFGGKIDQIVFHVNSIIIPEYLYSNLQFYIIVEYNEYETKRHHGAIHGVIQSLIIHEISAWSY